jgi:NAD+ diphosphatase
MAATDPTHPYAFAAPELDRASETREHDHVLHAAWKAADTRVIVLRRDGRVLADAAGAQLVRLGNAGLDLGQVSYLGRGSSGAVFGVALDDDASLPGMPAAARYIDLRSAAAQLGAGEAALAAFARSLLHWQSRKRYCGRCGAPARLAAGGHRALCTDTACAQAYFPRTDPAIIVVVQHGRRCLLGRQAPWPARRYSALAGFVEPGETLEDAVRREVHEETGVRVGACRYVGSQPWPFPASLMLGFLAEAESEAIQVGAELEDARWFDADTLPAEIARGEVLLSPAISIAFHLIDHWFHGLTGARLAPGPALSSPPAQAT